MSRGRRLAELQPAHYVGQLLRNSTGVGIVRELTTVAPQHAWQGSGPVTVPIVEWVGNGRREVITPWDMRKIDDLDTYIADIERQCNAATEQRRRAERTFGLPPRPQHGIDPQ